MCSLIHDISLSSAEQKNCERELTNQEARFNSTSFHTLLYKQNLKGQKNRTDEAWKHLKCKHGEGSFEFHEQLAPRLSRLLM